MPDELVEAVPLLLAGEVDGWSAGDLRRLRTLLVDEYVGHDLREAVAAVDRLLGR